MKILIAEDTKDIVLSYTTILEERNHQVIAADNGEDCLCIYHEELQKVRSEADASKHIRPFDIVIADYKLPKINGLQVAREILAVSPRQRVILASAHFEDELIDCVYQLERIVELLRKPFTKEVLIETIEEYKEIYDELEKFGMDVIAFRGAELRYDQLVYILEVLRQVKKKQQMKAR
jgi:CheY-like chemotaxis protein